MKRLDEFSLIEKYFAPLSGAGSFNLKDDAALLNIPKGMSLVVTNDAIAEGVHFLKNTPPNQIAQKAIRTNLSDLAAKGAKPFSMSLALGLPNDCDEKWIKSFAKGLESDCKQFGLSLCGGDSFSTNSSCIVSITAYGYMPKIKYASRLGAKQGHSLFVTGSIGDAVLGLEVASQIASQVAEQKQAKPNASDAFLLKRYVKPEPRVESASIIAEYASAAMDISDGFVGDLDKLCAASRVSIEINLEDVPLSKQARNYLDRHFKGTTSKNVAVTKLLTGGDDYELLIAVPKSKVNAFEKAVRKSAIPFTFLGKFKAGKTIKPQSHIIDADGASLVFENRSYKHFGK